MRPSNHCAHAAAVGVDEQNLHTLQIEVSTEFNEMPGLTVTLAQAARLFGIDVARCERILDALVDQGVLATNGRTFFARADVGAGLTRAGSPASARRYA
jgi:hypothetical protein